MLTPERHKLIGDLCYAALEMEEPQRAAFLDQACAGDEDMRREVELMLAQETRAESFLESPVLDVAAKALAHNLNEAPSHRSVGRYQILSLIGAGGMGEVYRARDPRLRREVAIKVLPAALAGEGERMRRFHQESLVVSALNHPNIVTIYELGEADGQHFMVMEYVAGQTLRQRVAERLSLSESLEIGAQVASALQAAHAAGVIHRDIKPENVMVRPDGLVKVLDFGLAKLTEQQPAKTETESAAPTPLLTEAGKLLGTVSYMSPEQARGLLVDARTDIFSFGVMLYELIARRRPFEGATQIETLAAILHQEPTPLAQRAYGAPAELERIVSQALRKDRDARYQTMQALLADLRELKQRLEISAGQITSPDLTQPGTDLSQGGAMQNKRWLSIPALTVFIVLVILAAGSLAFWASRTTTTPGSGVAVLTERTLTYSLTVQKTRNQQPYAEPFESTGRELLGNEWEFRLNLISPQPGFLYLLNENSTAQNATGYRLLFPTPSLNAAQSYLAAQQRLQTGWYVFGQTAGVDKLWVVWAAQPVEELEAVKGVVNPQEIGAIRDPSQVNRVSAFLAQHGAAKPSAEPDEVKKQVVVKGIGDVLISSLELEHR